MNRKEKEQAIRTRLAPFVKGKRTAAYHAVRGEADIYTEGMLLPRTWKDGIMQFGTGNLIPGPFGIPEPHGEYCSPDSIEVILVPMVAFDGLDRLGYGGGYYDRYLKRTTALKIGIAFDEQETELDPAPWDVAMDMVITPTRIITAAYNEERNEGEL